MAPTLTRQGGGAGGGTRTAVSFPTASIASNASENDDVTVFKTSRALKVVTDRPARVRAYSTAAYRTADASRSMFVDPSGDHGCLLEVITATGLLTLDLAPSASLHNLDTTPAATIYFNVTNLDTVTGIVNTTLTVLQEE